MEPIAESLRVEHEAELKLSTPAVQEEIKAGEETVNTVYEEIKEEDKLRRWNYINFARRIRKMAREFIGGSRQVSGFGLRIRTEELKVLEVNLQTSVTKFRLKMDMLESKQIFKTKLAPSNISLRLNLVLRASPSFTSRMQKSA